MAKAANKNKENVPGLFYVDNQCIDCDLCRQMAPAFFKRHTDGVVGYSIVHRQPITGAEIQKCQTALEDCPVNAIGRMDQQPSKTVSPISGTFDQFDSDLIEA